MIPSRTSHSSSIGPGVVPRGADPAYDEEVKREYDLRKNVPHLGKGSKGRPFSIDPNVGVMTRTQCVLFFLFFPSLDDLLLFFDATLVNAVRLAVCFTLCARDEFKREISRDLFSRVFVQRTNKTTTRRKRRQRNLSILVAFVSFNAHKTE